MQLLKDKRALIVGVANERSLAWAIARYLHEGGAQLAFTYQNDVLEKRVKPLAESVGSALCVPCDVSKDEDVASAFQQLKQNWDSLDILIHAVAYAQREDLDGRYIDTSRQGFQTALDISAYSLVSLAHHAAPLMKGRDASIVTLTYYGSEKVVPNYNVMGVAKAALEASVRYLAEDLGPQGTRINAISAGPVKTLAAKGIKGFNGMLHHAEDIAPLRRNIQSDDVGKTALYLCSDLATNVTGEVLHVDCGYNIKAM